MSDNYVLFMDEAPLTLDSWQLSSDFGTSSSWILTNGLGGTLRLQVTGANWLLADSLFYATGDLPDGFVPLTATVHFGVNFFVGTHDIAFQFDEATEGPVWSNPSSPADFVYPGTVPDAATLAANGCGCRGTVGTGNLAVGRTGIEAVSALCIRIYGTYLILTVTSSTGGAPIQTPAHGPLMGGTTFTLAGTGFTLGTPTVDVDGNPATGVVVDSDVQITCVSPAFAGVAGPQNVVVTIDAVSVTLPNGFLYDATPGAWYLAPNLGYQFFATDPGAPWVAQIMAPDLAATVGALQNQPCPWFIPTYIIRLIDPAVYADLIANYGLGPTPILLGLSPNDAVTITGAPLNLDPSDAAQSVWPQVYVDPAAPFVLGVGISLSDGGGTVAVSYATPFGRPCDDALWKWQALVVLEPLGITYDAVTNPAPTYTSAVVPPGDAVPDGALLTGGPGFGNNGGGGGNLHVTPCGCPPE